MSESNHQSMSAGDKAFLGVFAFLQVLLVVLFSTCTDYHTLSAGEDNAALFYSHYTDVTFMIFVGFGFLMTFLRRYAFGAVGFTLCIAAFCFQWGLLVMGFMEQLQEETEHGDGFQHKIAITIQMLVEGNFSSAAVLISFGAVLGKVNPLQLLVMSFLEVLIYGFNFYLSAYRLGGMDVGGSLVIHMFGAYFGMAVCFMVCKKGTGGEHPRNNSSPTSDTFAMIGTVILYMLWPSFNSVLVSDPETRLRVIVNTTLAMSSSAMAAFIASGMLGKGKFDMVHIQNATIAGGVGIGASADLVIGPGGALGTGLAVGVLSVLGYVFLTPRLEKIGFRDTCGVHNLHGMPGMFGGIVSALVIAAADESSIAWNRADKSEQAAHQIAALGTSLGMAIVGGLLTGFIISKLPGVAPENAFHDREHWEYEFVTDTDEADAKALAELHAASSQSASIGHPVIPAMPSLANNNNNNNNNNSVDEVMPVHSDSDSDGATKRA